MYGFNEVAQKPYRLQVLEAISYSINPLVTILLLAALVAAFTGNFVNASILITILTISIGLDWV
ncbi:hypothetical protein [Legionella norrlandica]|uniref:hypothetical protein n=1 Tax=Legionella norrlandica TaxID=1498499 RepID=UPI0030C66B87